MPNQSRTSQSTPISAKSERAGASLRSRSTRALHKPKTRPIAGKSTLRKALAAAAGAAALLCAMVQSPVAFAQSLPDVVKMPSGGMNLGGTSFFDGFGRKDPGFVFIEYGRIAADNRIVGSDGKDVPIFSNPNITGLASLNQLLYFSPLRLGDGAFGYNVIVPLVAFSTSFGPGLVLHPHSADIADITTGPFYQSDAIIRDGRPIFSWRAEFDFLAPVGGFDASKDINQSSGFWSINPYLAFTALPTPNIEVSARFQYIYNFSTSNIANPPPVPGLVYRSGQAGSGGFVNFTASYAITPSFSLGLNGFALQQFDNDKTNGIDVANSKESLVFLGPGFHAKINKENLLNFNVYLPTEARNAAVGPIFNAQFIHVFE